jgi:hypothetical protein
VNTHLLVELHEAALVLDELRAGGHVVDGAHGVGHLQVRLRQQLPQLVVLCEDLHHDETLMNQTVHSNF